MSSKINTILTKETQYAKEGNIMYSFTMCEEHKIIFVPNPMLYNHDLVMLSIEFSILVDSWQMNLHGVFVFKLLTAILTSIDQSIWEMNTLNVVHQVVLSSTCFLAYSAFKHLGLGVEHGVLFEHTSWISAT